FQTRPKLLIVIDESHNLRNDKSLRYKFLVEQLLIPQNTSREVKVLQLSATPINNELIDIRNQFKLIAQGQDDGFKNTDLEIDSLESLFRSVQRDFNEWEKKQTRKIADFIAKLPKKFEKLSDSLIVARTRKLIENEFGTLKFPTKEKPINEYISPENIDKLRSLEDILDALFINLTAYRPADYMQVQEPKNVLHDEKQRQRYLVKMMYILLVKRLESCWFSFKITIENILKYHFEVLSKVKQFLETRKDNLLEEKIDEEYKEELEETAIQLQSADFITLGKKQPIRISTITDLERFRKDLEIDIQKLSYLKENLENYQKDFLHGKVQDEKLNKLLEHITQKQQNLSNKKVLVFTSFKDTAKFLYEELKKRGITNIAFVSGTISESADGYVSSKFEAILERFAPYTKLYLEKDWSSLYEKCLPESYQEAGKWNVSYEKWKEIISKYDTITYYKLAHPIDVLIATDCLSEGQNLQDCDMVINYDIHWNPVRLIQRMGRIDRIGSPNSTITGINFWPAKSYEDYLNLKKKVENRMALMTIVGTEVDDKLTPELERTIQENPILTQQAQKMLQQLQLTWEDVETNEETLGFNDLSLEQFRQELFEYFKRNEEYFKNIPNGVFTGFRLKPHHKWQNIPSSLVAVLGYPKRTDSQDTQHKYREIYLLHQSIEAQKNDAKFLLTNFQEILSMLRYHKTEPRYVPREIDNGDKEILQKLASRLHQWIYAQASTSAVNQIQDLFTGDMKPLKISPEEKKLEEKFIPENFDLINWFVISET
ncbi:MAG: DEAD/DEAH box helicase, partial [Raineya sp.]|nr:DEAD/DEAH box helicase [Raineya sp.]